MRMKRPQGYKHIKCPHCGEKVKVMFRTLHRLKIEAVKTETGNSPRPWNLELEAEVEEGG